MYPSSIYPWTQFDSDPIFDHIKDIWHMHIATEVLMDELQHSNLLNHLDVAQQQLQKKF